MVTKKTIRKVVNSGGERLCPTDRSWGTDHLFDNVLKRQGGGGNRDSHSTKRKTIETLNKNLVRETTYHKKKPQTVSVTTCEACISKPS